MAPLVLALVFCGLFIHHVSYHVRPSVPLLKCLTLSRYKKRSFFFLEQILLSLAQYIFKSIQVKGHQLQCCVKIQGNLVWKVDRFCRRKANRSLGHKVPIQVFLLPLFHLLPLVHRLPQSTQPT